MTAYRPDDLIRAFIAEGREELPDRAFDAVRGDIHRTRQRVVIGPWREPQMTNLAKVAVAAAAVVAIAVGATRLLQTGTGPGADLPSPTPTLAPSESASPAADVIQPGDICLAGSCQSGALVGGGTYRFVPSTILPIALSFTVPAGWALDDGGFVTKQATEKGEVLFTAWDVTHVFSDICNDADLVDGGTTIGELANAIAAQRNQTASTVSDAEMAGYPAKRLQVTVAPEPGNTSCGRGIRPWPDPGPDLSGGYSGVPPDAITDLWVVDVGGQRVVVFGRHRPASSAQDVAELNGIVDSVTFDPPAASQAP
jgi:hypothetical protein